MEDYNLLDYNQHQLMKRTPTLVTGPNLVFLAPTKKVLRIPILKCKIIIVRNHMAILPNQPLICTSISPHHSVGQSATTTHHCYSSLFLISIAHHYCSSLLLITAAHH